MKLNLNKSLYWVILIILPITNIFAMENSNTKKKSENTLVIDFGEQFSRQDFLKRHGKKRQIQKDNKNLNSLCWGTLYALRATYMTKGDSEGKAYVYMTMAKFLLAHNNYPSSVNPGEEAAFVRALINDNRETIKNYKNCNTVAKWSYYYLGQLFTKYASEFVSEEKKNIYFAKAMEAFETAIRNHSTKTNNILAARLILVNGYVPEYMSSKEARDYAYSLLKKAEKINKVSEPNKKTPQITPKHRSLFAMRSEAQPIYMKGLNVKWYEALQMSSGEEYSTESSIEEIVVTDEPDILLDFSWSTLDIPMRADSQGLTIRDIALNPRGHAHTFYVVDGKGFKRQNVSGSGLHCFFNAIGLNPAEQAAFLLEPENKNDPVIRAMIANEIVSAAANPEELPASVKFAVNFAKYTKDRELINDLQVAHAQVEGGPGHHILPEHLQNVAEEDQELLEELRTRARSIKAYTAFVRDHIGKENMMVTLRDVHDNGHANFTSIDAIAHARKIGLKIYKPSTQGGLELIHTFIGQDATEIAYIYYKNNHFQALKPITDEFEFITTVEGFLDNNNNIDENQVKESIYRYVDNKTDVMIFLGDKELHFRSGAENPNNLNLSYNNHKWKFIAGDLIENPVEIIANTTSIVLPSAEVLGKLYPHIQAYCNGSKFNDDTVRKVLYLKEVKKLTRAEVATFLKLAFGSVAKILVANEHRIFHKVNSQKIINAFHNLSIEEKEKPLSVLTKKLNMDSAVVLKVLEKAGLYTPKKRKNSGAEKTTENAVLKKGKKS